MLPFTTLMLHAVNAICGFGALFRFLPLYSPDLNPIECVFGEVKQFLQANNLLLEISLSIPSILLMAFQSITIITVENT